MDTMCRAAGLAGVALAGTALIYSGYSYFANRSVTLEPTHSVANKVAVVTGANSGIGLALTKSLLNRNCKVYSTYRNEDRSQELLGLAKDYPNNVITVKADFSTHESLNSATINIKQVIGDQKVDLVVINAGYFEKGAKDFGTLDASAMSTSLLVNATAGLVIAQELETNLDKSNDPMLVYISSRRGSIARNLDENYKGRMAYRISKTAGNMGFSSISQTKENWWVGIIHPGAVKTNLPSIQKDCKLPEESAEAIIRVIEHAGKSGLFLDEKGQEIPW